MEIFQYDFMIRAFIAGIAVAIIAPLIGIFLVVRRYSLMSDTLAHISLAGLAIGFLLEIYPIGVAVITTVIASFFMEKLRNSKRVFGESILALFISGSLAIAIVLISISKGFNVDLFSYLFGSIATVSTQDIYLIVALCAIVIFVILRYYESLFAVSFNEELSKARGVPVEKINLMLIVLAAISVTIIMQIVGILLVGALMVIPVISAMQLKKSFANTIVIAEVFSFISVISGLFISYYLDIASGGSIVVVALFIFLLCYFASKE